MPEVSIIIRTKNEERWIGHCLDMVYQQTLNNFEVVLVDNQSIDHTLEIANRYPIDCVINIEEFRPGYALNEGVRASSGDYIVCLSAHCVPKDKFWLENLRGNFEGKHNLAGVYGRQLPLSFTNPIDKRDLLIVFGKDSRIQKEDYFFHNANSMMPRAVWEKFPFDEHVSNIEDRVWGKQVIDAGYEIAYDSHAAVYHHHGLHQGNDARRASGVVSILEQVDAQIVNELPKSLQPGRANVTALLPVSNKIFKNKKGFEYLSKTISELMASSHVSNIYLISDERINKMYPSVGLINRAEFDEVDNLAIDEVLQKSLVYIENKGEFPELVLYVNYEYINRPLEIFDQLIADCLIRGLDSTFPAFKDYGHYWYLDENGSYRQTDRSMRSRIDREPTYRALYGLGTVTASHTIRKGKLIGEKVGIVEVDNIHNSFRLGELS